MPHVNQQSVYNISHLTYDNTFNPKLIVVHYKYFEFNTIKGDGACIYYLLIIHYILFTIHI